jgi:hypothetical protein
MNSGSLNSGSKQFKLANIVIASYFTEGLTDFNFSINDLCDSISVYSIEVFGPERGFFINLRFGNILF